MSYSLEDWHVYFYSLCISFLFFRKWRRPWSLWICTVCAVNHLSSFILSIFLVFYDKGGLTKSLIYCNTDYNNHVSIFLKFVWNRQKLSFFKLQSEWRSTIHSLTLNPPKCFEGNISRSVLFPFYKFSTYMLILYYNKWTSAFGIPPTIFSLQNWFPATWWNVLPPLDWLCRKLLLYPSDFLYLDLIDSVKCIYDTCSIIFILQTHKKYFNHD